MSGFPATKPIISLDASAHDDWDVVVIGAGVAGAMTAFLAAQNGLHTLLLEKHSFPRDKVCGGCVNARALQVLDAAGLGHLMHQLHAPEITHFALHQAGRTTRLGAMQGRAVSRRALDSALVDAAQTSGVCFLPRTQATVGASDPAGHGRIVRLERDGEQAQVTARIVVAADGLGHPSLRDLPGFQVQVARRSHIGIGATWDADQAAEVAPDQTISMSVGRHGYVGVVQVEQGRLNVAAAVSAEGVKRRGVPGVVRDILVDAGQDHPLFHQVPWVGTRPLTCQSRVVAAPRLFLVGDATGYVEPFTGEGIAWALASAWQLRPLLRNACESWRDEYVRAWSSSRRLRRGHEQRICRAVRLTLRVPLLVGSAMTVLARFPALATPIVRHLNRPWRPEEVPS